MSCEGKSKATVAWKWDGESEQKFETKKPPVQVSVTPVSSTEYSTWVVKNSAGVIIYDIYGVEAYLFPNKTYGRVDSPGDYLVEFKQTPTSVFWIAALWKFPVTLELSSSTGCRIDIYDSTGKVFTETKAKQCPTYKIKCDDDCAEGEMKCKCNHYPGYCCIPCADIKSKVSQAASTLRQVRA